MLRAYKAAYPDTKHGYVDSTGVPLDTRRVYRARSGGLYWRSGFLGIERGYGGDPWLVRNVLGPLAFDTRRGGRFRRPWWFWRFLLVMRKPPRTRTRRDEARQMAGDVVRELRLWWRRQPPLLCRANSVR